MVERIRVFLADDHTVLREATAELIDNQPDMEVVGQASTGQETFELVKQKCPDVVVMDIAMPRVDGLEATRLIVAECPYGHVVILYCLYIRLKLLWQFSIYFASSLYRNHC